MKRLFPILLAVALAAAPAADALDRRQAEALLRVAVKLSRLKAQTPVRVVEASPARLREQLRVRLDRLYPPAAQAHDEHVFRALGLHAGEDGTLRRILLAGLDAKGVYDARTATAYVAAGRYARKDALHALVHALADQNARFHRIERLPGRDARLAAAAAVEGYAALVVSDPPARRPVGPDEPRLIRFLRLERAFVLGDGLRFATDLRALGGVTASIESLRRLPATTEQILHLDRYLRREPAIRVTLPAQIDGLRLASAGTFGELDVRALLTAFDVPQAARAAAGWGGGRSARYVGPDGDAIAVVLRWDTARDAREWRQAVASWTPAALAGRAVAFEQSAGRTALVVGTLPEQAEAVARRLVEAS